MNWMLAAGILSLFAIMGAVIRLIIAGWPDRPSKPSAEPENSHPGRVLPRGVCIGHALRSVAPGEDTAVQATHDASDVITNNVAEQALAALSAVRMTIESKVASASPFVPFREGQWLRVRTSGRLVQFYRRSARPDHFWCLTGDESAALIAQVDLEPALPRKYECWQKLGCQARHAPPYGTAWLDHAAVWCYTSGEFTAERLGPRKQYWDLLFTREAEACRCGCLVPVDFGRGPSAAEPSGAVASVPQQGDGLVAVSSCRDCGEIVAMGGVLAAVHRHGDGSSHEARTTRRAMPMAGERWRFDNCPGRHLHPRDLADLTKSGDFSYDEGGVLFTVKTDWEIELGIGACLECGCLRRTTEDQAREMNILIEAEKKSQQAALDDLKAQHTAQRECFRRAFDAARAAMESADRSVDEKD
jgi:hypothetical protein